MDENNFEFNLTEQQKQKVSGLVKRADYGIKPYVIAAQLIVPHEPDEELKIEERLIQGEHAKMMAEAIKGVLSEIDNQ